MISTIRRMQGMFWSGVIGLALFTLVVDLLLLVQPLYMLQVYDRVLVSNSLQTLFYISFIALAALLLLGLLDGIRNMVAARLAAKLDVAAGADALLAAINGPRASLGDVQPLRDLSTIRAFISGRGLFSFLDLPFAPVFIGLMYFIHPDLFWLTVAGAVVLALLAAANQWAAARGSTESGEASVGAMLSAQAIVRSAESVKAMGLAGNLVGVWGSQEARALMAQERINRVNSIFGGLSRFFRMVLQIAILGFGAYLVLVGEMTAGMIFASALISGRGLQPIDQIIAGWKGYSDARDAWKRLKAVLLSTSVQPDVTDLPAPTGNVQIENVVVFAPGASGGIPILKRISAAIAKGECIAVIGPSGAGKSTLVRTLVGAAEMQSGAVRFDGGDLRNWDRAKLGRNIGYLAQEVDILPGTIAQNIARFDPDAADADIVAAATKAQVHELVQRFPNGYDTAIGPGGLQLSGGQRQRIGLARAFYGAPPILVLDEPNSALDSDGEAALDRALVLAKQEGVTVIVVTQRRPLAERADKVLVLRDGALEDFGPPAEVFARQIRRMQASATAQPATESPPSPPTVVSGRFSPVYHTGLRNLSQG